MNISPYVMPGMIPKRARTNAEKVELIKEIVCEEYGIHSDKLISKSRKREFAQARMFCMYLVCIHTNLSLKLIGSEFGGRDHSTVIHARDTISDEIILYSDLRARMERISTKLYQEQLYKITI